MGVGVMRSKMRTCIENGTRIYISVSFANHRLDSVFILFLAEALEENPIERAQARERTVITSYCGTLTRILCALQCVPSSAHSIGGVEIANRFESPAQHC